MGKGEDRGNLHKETSKEPSRYRNKSVSFTVLFSYLFISSGKNSHTDKQKPVTHTNNNKTLLFSSCLLHSLPPYFLTPLSLPDPQSNAFRAAFNGAGKVSSSSSPSTPSPPPPLPWNIYA